eukprot:11369580-Alexandrium_andersonii.AAC.1
MHGPCYPDTLLHRPDRRNPKRERSEIEMETRSGSAGRRSRLAILALQSRESRSQMSNARVFSQTAWGIPHSVAS